MKRMIKQMMTTLTMINIKMINSRTTTTEETLSVNNCTKIVPAKINKTDTMIDLAETIWMIRIKVKTRQDRSGSIQNDPDQSGSIEIKWDTEQHQSGSKEKRIMQCSGCN